MDVFEVFDDVFDDPPPDDADESDELKEDEPYDELLPEEDLVFELVFSVDFVVSGFFELEEDSVDDLICELEETDEVFSLCLFEPFEFLIIRNAPAPITIIISATKIPSTILSFFRSFLFIAKTSFIIN